MKYLIAFSLLTLSISAFADQNLNDQLGQDKGEYQQCMNDTADCTVGCEKKCAHLNPIQFEADMASSSKNTGKAKASAVQN
jgi:hypothetical protein